jgi:hypothetical protein
MVAALVQLAGGLAATLWESGSQWAAPQHDLPIAIFTAVAALGGGRGAMAGHVAQDIRAFGPRGCQT